MLIEEYNNKIKIECDEDIIDINNEQTSIEFLNLSKNTIDEIRLNNTLVEIFTKNNLNYIIEASDPEIAEELYDILNDFIN